MLYMPETASSTAVLIGIDPGSSKLGFCVMTVNVITWEILSTNAFTIVGEKLMKKDGFLGHIHGERFSRIDAIGLRLLELFKLYQPNWVASESPFFNPSRPNAFEVLVEVLFKIRQSLWQYDPWVSLYRIDPPTVKNGVGAKGGSSKDPVRDAILAMAPELKYIGKTPLDKLDNNAIDSIAVAKTRLELLRGNICPKVKR